MRDFADDAAAEDQHAGNKDNALNHHHPLPEPGQINCGQPRHRGREEYLGHD